MAYAMETFFDFVSASGGAILGALFTYLLNRDRNRKMSSQLVVSRQALEKIKLENTDLLRKIHEKEDLILQMQMQILGDQAPQKTKKRPSKK